MITLGMFGLSVGPLPRAPHGSSLLEAAQVEVVLARESMNAPRIATFSGKIQQKQAPDFAFQAKERG